MKLLLTLIVLINAESLISTVRSYKQKAIEQLESIRDQVEETLHIKDVNKEPMAICPKDSSHQLEFTRYGVVYCLHYLADKNCDHKIDAVELTAFKNEHLNLLERGFFAVGTSVEAIMNACDKNKDGYIDDHEFVHKWDGCLNEQYQMCKARDICYREITNNQPICKN